MSGPGVPTEESAIWLWKEHVYDKGSIIDPHAYHEWDTLAYGYFLGLGFHPVIAEKLRMAVYSKGWM